MAKQGSKKAPLRRKGNRYRVSPEVKKERRKRILALGGLVAGFLVAVFVLSSVFVLGYRYLITTPYLRINSVEVKGCKWLEPKKVKKISGLHPGQNLLAVNLKKIRKKIEQNPWVSSVVINRVIPDEIVIEIEEKRPFAMVRFGDNSFYLIDEKGDLIVPVKVSDRYWSNEYLVVTGLNREKVMEKGRIPREACEQIKQFISMSEANYSWFRPRDIKEVRWSRLDGLTISFGKGPVVIKLGKGEFSLKFLMLRRVLGEISRRNIEGQVKEIDLRCSPRVYISSKYNFHLVSG